MSQLASSVGVKVVGEKVLRRIDDKGQRSAGDTAAIVGDREGVRPVSAEFLGIINMDG